MTNTMQPNIIRAGLLAITLLVLLAAGDGAAQPSVEWGTYLGGTGNEHGRGMAVDASTVGRKVFLISSNPEFHSLW